MARQRTDKLLSSLSGYGGTKYVNPLRRGIKSFVDFMDVDNEVLQYSQDDDRLHKECVWFTRVGYQADKNDVWEAKCLLDYVYIWLAQGPAGLHCPTYESYLLSVIAIIEEFYFVENPDSTWGYLLCFKREHGDGFRIFYWGEKVSDDYEYPEQALGPGHTAVNVLENTPRDAENYDHPALSRDAYEFYRQRVLAEEGEKKMKELLRDALAPNE
jgi:hypothetical protein